MKRKFLFPAMLMVLGISTLYLGGCASSPLGKYSQVNDTFIASVHTLIQAKEANQISDADWTNEVLPAIQIGDELLDQYESAVEAGAPTTSIEEQLSQVIQTLQPFILKFVTHNSS